MKTTKLLACSSLERVLHALGIIRHPHNYTWRWAVIGRSCLLILALAAGLGARQAEGSEIGVLKRRAERGDAAAQLRLGRIYEYGLGVRESLAVAAKWYRKAAEQDLPQAEYSLARIYMDGESLARDYVQAVKFLRKAAAHDYALAKNRLGVMYERGLGLPKDEVEAYAWYTLAANSGNIAGMANRDNLASRLSPAQVLEAEKRAEAESIKSRAVASTP
jgi:hypothetical protein